MTTADAIAHLLTVPEHSPVPGWAWQTARTQTGYEYRTPPATDVCAGASLPPDVGVLATVGASEFPVHYPAYLLAGMACVINDARALYPADGADRAATGILNRVTRAKVASGYLGRQSGRWCSSFQPPTLRTVEAARLALQGVGAELAREGRRWIDLKVQDGGMQAGKKLDHDGEFILLSRYKDGWKWIGPVEGIDPYVLCILARDGVSLDEALVALKDGQKRWGRAASSAVR